MAEIFRVQLVSLYQTPEVEGYTAEPLLHVELAINNQCVAREDHQGLLMGSTGILARHHYKAVCTVKQLEEGLPFKLEGELRLTNPKPPMFVHVEGGGRLFLLHPIEQNSYLLAITIPHAVWRWFGPVALQILLSTAITGYEVEADVAAVSSVPAYYSLHNRVSENATAVQEALRARMQQMIGVTTNLDAFVKRETLQSPASSQTAKQVVSSVHKMCTSGSSSLRHDGRFRMIMHKLMLSATSCSNYISLNGAIACNGLRDGYKRLVVTATAVWYRGEPVFSTGSTEDFQMYLLPAAMTVYMYSLVNGSAHQVVTKRCFAMRARTGADCLRVPGYVRQLDNPHHREAAICLSFASQEGWCIAVQMEVAVNDFTGAPMSHIVSGVVRLISTTLETPRFLHIMSKKCMETLSCAPTTSLFPESICAVMESVRQIGMYQHRCNNSAHAVNAMQNTCIYCYSKGDSYHPGSTADYRVPWPKSLDVAVAQLVKLASSSFLFRSRCTPKNGNVFSPELGKVTPFTVLRTNRAIAVIMATMALSPEVAVNVLVLELSPKALTTAALRAFASWLMWKIM